MGSFFSQTVEAKLAGRTVRRARLVFLGFLAGPVRLFEGAGQLYTQDGNVWSGGGQLASIGDIEAPHGGQASVTSFSLSGVDPSLIVPGLDAGTQAKGRDVSVLTQHYDDDWRPLDGPYTTFWGLMDTMKISADGPTKRTVTLNAEGIFTARGFAPFAFASDRDQKRLHPGDQGAEYLAQMTGKYTLWPIL